MSVFQPFAFRQQPQAGGGLPDIYTNNLVAWWDFGNPDSYSGTGATVTDLSPNLKDGTIVGSPTFVSDYGGGLQLNNVGAFNPNPHQHVNNRTNMFVNSNVWTVCFIGSYIPIQTAYGRIIGDIMQGGSGDVTTASTTAVQYCATGGSQGFWHLVGAGSFTYNQPSMISVSFSSNTATNPAPWQIQLWNQTTRYVNDTDTGGTQIIADRGLRWGTGENQREGVSGINFVLMAYNVALSQTEIEQNYNAYKSRYGWA